MASRKNKKIIRYRKPLQINIGIIIFAIIFLYIVYYIFSFVTTKHISGYEVEQGTIAQNTNFTGLILREEHVFYAQESGYVNYFIKDGTKAAAGADLYSVDANGDFYKQLTKSSDGQLKLSKDAYKQLEDTADNYTSNYSDMDFYQSYQFKYDMEASLMEAIRISNLNEINAYTEENKSTGTFHIYPADRSGIVVYNIDGWEEVTTDNFTEEMFAQSSYKKENFISREKVSEGEPVYKMLTSESWDVLVPVEKETAADLSKVENIKVRFKKDNSTAWALSNILEKDGKYYLELTFNNSMIRFSTDRYLDLELILSDTSGLKIPNTSIVTKEFWSVPKEYVSKGGSSDYDGVLKEVTGKDGEVLTEFVRVSLFYETDTEYYIDGEGFTATDTQSSLVALIKPDSSERYTLKNKESLQGVYNINKGYAVFKRIDILFQNEEYTIIDTGTNYGIALYDHIALDGSVVKENDIIH